MVLTSLSEEIQAEEVLQIYQLRWQVELLFNRLKSIFGIGNIPNKKAERIQAWLIEKIMVTLLLENEIEEPTVFPKETSCGQRRSLYREVLFLYRCMYKNAIIV